MRLPMRCPSLFSQSSDHLRSRGEHVPCGPFCSVSAEPPPLVRRAPRRGGRSRVDLRTTSARAESTPRSNGTESAVLDHLRSRGEHVTSNVDRVPLSGPPRLARRAPASEGAGPIRLRTTSARAESTGREPDPRACTPDHLRSRGEHTRRARGSCEPPDHLRSRGEHRIRTLRARARVGPPPLARRARRADVARRRVGRTTSARAESTTAGTWRRRGPSDHLRSRGEHCNDEVSTVATTDHLRSRGEHWAFIISDVGLDGPPPLARRARLLIPLLLGRFWTTSARAESTGPRRVAAPKWADHLRSRGEHAATAVIRFSSSGPPPLARRAHVRARRDPAPQRTTSARAESTSPPGHPAHPGADHLRSRGEHASVV